MCNLDKYVDKLKYIDTLQPCGRIIQVVGLIIQSHGPCARLGELCYIVDSNNKKMASEVVGFKDERVLLMPLGTMEGIKPGCKVISTGHAVRVQVGPGLIGRVLDGFGRVLDGKPSSGGDIWCPIESIPPHPLTRLRVKEPLTLGIRAIDGMLTCGKGQRMGIFAGSGVGKSVLMGMIARNTAADINVISLVGERGREVREFLEKDLGPEGLARSVVVVATSDQPALIRLKAALVATTIAEYFRDQGKDVMLMMDSLTRVATAQREVGLAVGEPPATRGFTPSVFALLPKLLERTGTSEKGTITGLYTVLVEGDDLTEPVTDIVRATLDGHIILSRELAAQNHYPAIDILNSVSRVMIDLVDPDHLNNVGRFREILATYNEAKDLLDIGAYKKGTNPQIDYAVEKYKACLNFLRQEVREKSNFEETKIELASLFEN